MDNKKEIKVLVSVVGRFHAFDLAKQLNNNKILYKINTTYPKFKVKEWGINSDCIKSNLYLEILKRYGSKIIDKATLERFIFISQAKSNISLIKNSDIFIGWSGSSLEALQVAKKLKKVTILERGSAHYTYQMNILKEEYRKYDKTFKANDWMWQRELKEYELADYISIPSTFVKNTFIEQGVPEGKLIVNPYGVDLTHFKKIEKKDNIFRIITSGNLSIQKGTKYLLEAFNELALPNSEIWHVGSINEDMKDWLSSFRNKNVHFLGHKPQNELYKYYSQGSLFVLMSLQEGLAMVQPQAMACGLPIVISTNTGGSDLISKDGCEGYVIPIRDKDRLKEILVELYNNPEKLCQMSKNAQDRVKRGFTWDDYGNRYVEYLLNNTRSFE